MAQLLDALQDETNALKVELQNHQRDASNLQQQIARYGHAEPPSWLRDLHENELQQVGNLQSRIALIERRHAELTQQHSLLRVIFWAALAVMVVFGVLLAIAIIGRILPPLPKVPQADSGTVIKTSTPTSPVVLTPMPVATSTQVFVPHQPEASHWKQIPLDGVVQARPWADFFAEVPTDNTIIYGGTTFALSNNGSVIETESRLSPTSDNVAKIRAQIWSPLAIHLLINLSYGYQCYTGKTVGQIRLLFSDGSVLSTDLIAGQNIREWVNNSGTQPYIVAQAAPGSGLMQQVWKGHHVNSGGEAVVDMLSLDIPREYQDYKLDSIEIEDFADRFLGDLPTLAAQCAASMNGIPFDRRDPGLLVFGVVVDSQ